ncbi:MAG: V-type ATP synthase subunit I [Rikenellaceae bacterium]
MIAKMSKYDFVLYSREYKEFIEKVRALGLVDITTSGWESSEKDREIIAEIEARTKAETQLKEFATSQSYSADAKPSTETDVYGEYTSVQAKRTEVKGEITSLEKSADESRVWGEFSAAALDQLESSGVKLRYFVAADATFEQNRDAWSQQYTLELINSAEGNSYFVVISIDSSELSIDAQELKRPAIAASEASQRISELSTQLTVLDQQLSSCVNSIQSIEDEREAYIFDLQRSKVRSTATEAADGSLLLMSAWAEEESSAKVDALLEEYPGVIYLKGRPTPEDDTPVKLTNGWFPRIFELVGNMYALPKYGTIDLTPFFAPFYMLFFAICLCDAGYGAMILAAGLGLYFKGGEGMRQASWLTILCGTAAVVFGFLANSLFGMPIGSAPIFRIFDFQKDFFSISMMIGVVQILLGMAVNIVVSTRAFGFKYALGSLGWFLLLLATVISAALSSMGIEAFGFSSIPFYAVVSISLVLMLFFNSPDKNIFANFGAGIWNTYNNVTGLLGDVLSYVRLFAIGLSGGVLAIVFNSLALGITGLDAGIAGQPIETVIFQIIGAVAILLIGHGINLFMSTISSFVHPMRLTFVEFFKNAGFEMTTRKFDPLK